MEEAAVRRQYEAIHEDRPWHNGTFDRWTAERTTATPYHYLDGVDLGVTEVDMSPDDNFLSPIDLFGRPTSDGGDFVGG